MSIGNPGIEARSPTLQADSLPAKPPEKPKNTGVGNLSPLQGIFPTQESNQGFLHCRRARFDSWLRKICWRRDRLPIRVFLGFPCGLAGKESACNAGGLGSIPGLGRSPGGGKGCPLQYSGLENSMDCIVHGVAKSRTRLSDFHFLLTSSG